MYQSPFFISYKSFKKNDERGSQGPKVQGYSRKKVEAGLGEDWQIGEVM
jgi:hypothetical protein